MKVLTVGRGVVGTIYGWALDRAGINVTHVVRKEGLPGTDTLDLLDLRPGYPKHTRATYAPKTVRQISPSDGFDLVMVASKHYQAAEAIRRYLPGAPRASFLLFTAIGMEPGRLTAFCRGLRSFGVILLRAAAPMLRVSSSQQSLLRCVSGCWRAPIRRSSRP